jgi:signal transduction histidine kinase
MGAAPDLVAALGHELRTPVASIIGAATLLERSSELDAGVHDRLVAIVLSEAQRLSRMLDDMLAVGVDAAGPLELSPVDAAAVVRAVVDRGTLTSRYEDHVVIIVKGEEHAPARGHADSIERIVTNLLDNGVRHAQDRVVIETSVGATGATVSVTDDGPGVPEELGEHVFEPLVGWNDSGTGLGLWLSSRLAERMGGSLRLDVGTGVGARFILEIPGTDLVSGGR